MVVSRERSRAAPVVDATPMRPRASLSLSLSSSSSRLRGVVVSPRRGVPTHRRSSSSFHVASRGIFLRVV